MNTLTQNVTVEKEAESRYIVKADDVNIRSFKKPTISQLMWFYLGIQAEKGHLIKHKSNQPEIWEAIFNKIRENDKKLLKTNQLIEQTTYTDGENLIWVYKVDFETEEVEYIENPEIGSIFDYGLIKKADTASIIERVRRFEDSQTLSE